jgi:hypothetical protein
MRGSCEGIVTLPLSSPGLTGRSSTLRLLDSITDVSGILGHPPSRVTTAEYAFAFPRRVAPELCLNSQAPEKSEGAGKAGCWLAPAVSCATCKQKRTRAYRYQPGIRPSPRNGLTAYNALSLETNSSCLHRRRIDDSPKPGWAQNLRQLDTSHGCQNHTPLPYATAPSSGALEIAHGKTRPAIHITRRRFRVHRIPDPTSVTIAIRPSCGPGWRDL